MFILNNTQKGTDRKTDSIDRIGLHRSLHTRSARQRRCM